MAPQLGRLDCQPHSCRLGRHRVDIAHDGHGQWLEAWEVKAEPLDLPIGERDSGSNTINNLASMRL